MRKYTEGPWTLGQLQSYRGGDGMPTRFVYRPGDTAATRICVAGMNCDADATAISALPSLIVALQRLEIAAERRDSHMGDPIRLLDAKAELAAAAKHARDVLAIADSTTTLTTETTR